MGLLDLIDKSFLSLGGTIIGASQEVKRGATFDHKTVHFDGYNAKHAQLLLKDHGVDAWFVTYNLGKSGSVDVRKKDADKAKRILRDSGIDAW